MRTLKMLTAAATMAALAGGTATAQQAPSETGTDANGPITILKNMAPETGVEVDLNGEQVDHFRRVAYGDVTGVVHTGLNSLTVRWDQPVQRLDFKVAFAPTRNNFRNVVVVQDDASRDPALRQPGSHTYTFTIPG